MKFETIINCSDCIKETKLDKETGYWGPVWTLCNTHKKILVEGIGEII